MKLLLLTVALCATAYAALPTSEYLPPLEDAAPEASNVDLQSLSSETSPLADDGYRYKTVKRLRFRHRRDVSELPSNEYLPPAEESAASAPEPQVEAAPLVAAASQESAVLADDGYRYRTVKRYRLRRRRDVNELPSNEYLPPVQEAASEPAPVVDVPVVAESQDSAVLADDGYRYKTVKRYRIRRRRDVNELPSNEYLPPAEESQAVEVVEAAPAVAESQDSAVLADDGYRYKTVKRYRIRRRRDVNELPSNEYLPPVEEAASEPAPQVEAAPAVAESQDSAVLADDGYRYKTVKRYRIRRRRDVNELPSNEYLPPVQEAASEPAPQVESAPAVAESQDSAVLADDGYRYKTVKRYRIRRRRDVNELPSNEYLPPVQEAASEPAPVVDVPVVAESQDSAVLADDGYRYRTVKRYRIRRRRDVNELPSNEYLPPVQEAASEPAPVVDIPAAPVAAESQDSAVLADDGYRYKTLRRVVYRRRH